MSRQKPKSILRQGSRGGCGRWLGRATTYPNRTARLKALPSGRGVSRDAVSAQGRVLARMDRQDAGSRAFRRLRARHDRLCAQPSLAMDPFVATDNAAQHAAGDARAAQHIARDATAHAATHWLGAISTPHLVATSKLVVRSCGCDGPPAACGDQRASNAEAGVRREPLPSRAIGERSEAALARGSCDRN